MQGKQVYAYEAGIIDYWCGWLTFDEMYKKIKEGAINTGGDGNVEYAIQGFLLFIHKVYLAAVDLGWEGDIREGPYFTVYPGGEIGSGVWPLVMSWKQDNNGVSFLGSEIQLHIIKDDENNCPF